MVEVPPAKGRYVQMMGVATGSPYGYSLYEFTICAGEGGTSLRKTQVKADAGKTWNLAMTPHGLPLGLQAVDLTGKSRMPGHAGSAAAGIYIMPEAR